MKPTAKVFLRAITVPVRGKYFLFRKSRRAASAKGFSYAGGVL